MSADPTIWAEVDGYLGAALLPGGVDFGEALEAALQASGAAGLPPHHVAPNQGKLLHLLVRISGARTVLEIGTLGGYSTIWLAKALPAGGRLVTLERDPAFAAVAAQNLEHAGLGELVDLRFGPAAETLQGLVDAGEPPFDFIFIDADKPNNPEYLRLALELSRPGTVIVADNIVRAGAVADPQADDPRVLGVRGFIEAAAAEPRLTATGLQTVGEKGYDGFVMAIVGP